MIAFPAGVKVWIAGGVTDMRCYAASMIMWSPGQRGKDRLRTGRLSLSIILMVCPLQHGDELVRRRERARPQCWCACGPQGFELFVRIGAQVDLGALEIGVA